MSKRYTRVNVVPEYNHGDLVTAKGYEGDVLRVESYIIEAHRHMDSEWDYDCVVYDLTSLVTGDLAIADQNDMTLVADVAQADEYLKANKVEDPKLYDLENYEDPFIDILMTTPDLNKPVESKHREQERSEIKRRKEYRNTVNELMDQYNLAKEQEDSRLASDIMNEMEMRAVVFNAGGIWEEADSE